MIQTRLRMTAAQRSAETSSQAWGGTLLEDTWTDDRKAIAEEPGHGRSIVPERPDQGGKCELNKVVRWSETRSAPCLKDLGRLD